MLPRLLPVAGVLAAAAILPGAADAATYTVVQATHESTATKTDATYAGTSTARWSLARPTAAAPNHVSVQRGGGMVSGLGQLNVSGTYAVDATTPRGHCAFTAATGDPVHTADAPAPFTLAIGPDPRTGRGVRASFMATQATLGSPDLPSECSTAIAGEPDAARTSSVAVGAKAFTRRRVTLRFKGATADAGIAYRWRTTIVLRRKR